MSELIFRSAEFDFKKENKMTTKGKVLVLVSAVWLALERWQGLHRRRLLFQRAYGSGLSLMNEGYEITFANPKGNTPQLDANSAIAQFFGGDEAKLQDYLQFRDSLTGLKNPTRISDVIASGLDQYDAVFVPAAMAR